MNASVEGRARMLLDRIPALERRCDLDLLTFFAKHPRTLMSSEQLAKLLGYALGEIAQSLDVLLAAGLLTRTQNRTRLPRMYVFAAEGNGEWLPAFVEFASTRDGRSALRHALPDPPAARTNGLPAHAGEAAARGARPFLIPGAPERREPRPDEPEEGDSDGRP